MFEHTRVMVKVELGRCPRDNFSDDSKPTVIGTTRFNCVDAGSKESREDVIPIVQLGEDKV